MPFVGASNIDSGVTIDLVNLKGLRVSKDRTMTSVGPGNRWVDVYSALDTIGLSVVGGRVADIGVGGLITGGERPAGFHTTRIRVQMTYHWNRRHFLLLWTIWLGMR